MCLIRFHSALSKPDTISSSETGNRRFLPVKTTKIDVAGLKRDRDAILAAAYAEYLTSLPAQEAEHVTSLALQKLLADLRAERSDLSADRFLQKRQEVMQLLFTSN